MDYHFRNLVFEGGGVKGIAYAGALGVLDGKGILQNIVRVGGTSAGAINAALLGLNCSTKEVSDILGSLNFNNFLDASWGVIRNTERLVSDFGWYKGDFFRNWISGIIGDKTGNKETTFKQLQDMKKARGFRDLYFVGVNLSTGFAEVFSHEKTPDMPVAQAVRISMSIPLFFRAVRGDRGDVYVDGGLLDNYPVKLFDRQKYVERYSKVPAYYEEHNEALKEAGKEISPYVYNMETLGFRLDSPREIAVFRDNKEPVAEEIKDFFEYAQALVETIMEAQGNQHLHSDDWQRTIYIDTLGVKTTEFNLSDDRKQALVKSGQDGTATYFQWYDNPANKAVNRPDLP